MSFTYTNDPSNVPLDAVRFVLGDRRVGETEVSDQEIEYVLLRYPDPPLLQHVYLAAADCLEFRANEYAATANITVGKTRTQVSAGRIGGTMGALRKSAEDMRIRAVAVSTAIVYVGGQSLQEKLQRSQQTDLTQPSFKRSLGEFPSLAPSPDPAVTRP